MLTMNSVKILHAVRSAITAIAELLVHIRKLCYVTGCHVMHSSSVKHDETVECDYRNVSTPKHLKPDTHYPFRRPVRTGYG